MTKPFQLAPSYPRLKERFAQARTRNINKKAGVPVHPEEIRLYIRHIKTCPYTDDPLVMQKRGEQFVIICGTDTKWWKWETHVFHYWQAELDRWLQSRIDWERE